MLIDWLFPNRCLNCNQIIGPQDSICELCMDKIDFTHYDFYGMHPLKEKCKTLFPVDYAFALMRFDKDNLSRNLIHQLKYGGRSSIGKDLANWTFRFLNFEKDPPSLITSVPLHPKKMKRRGYNQLHLFVETLSELSQIPFHHELLVRAMHQKAQMKKKFSERIATDHVFRLNKEVEGQHILLVDDVFTTGSTMASAAWELLKSGKNRVSILVMAMEE